jgi:hypothetical protein
MMRGRRFTPFERAGLALAAAVVVAPVVLDGLRPDAAGDSIPGGDQLERDENRIRIRSLGPDALEGTDDDVVYPRDR